MPRPGGGTRGRSGSARASCAHRIGTLAVARVVLAGRFAEPPGDSPANVHVSVRHARLDLFRQVLALALDDAVGSRLAVDLDVGLGLLVEAQLLRAEARADLDIGPVVPGRHAIASRTSLTVMRPSAPVPSISSRSTPSSWAAFSAAGVALCFSARRWRRRSPSSLAFRAAAVPRSLTSSEAADPISCATVFTTTLASWPAPASGATPLPPEPSSD